MSMKNFILAVVLILILVPLFGALQRKNQKMQLSEVSAPAVAPAGRPALDMYAEEDVANVASDQVMMKRTAGGAEILPVPPGMPDNGGFTPTADRTIVKNASLSLLVRDTRQTVERAQAIAKEVNGFVTTSNVYENEYDQGVIRADMTLRVPVERLEETLGKLRGLADKITHDTLSADDRTEQKVDMEAQLTNLKATETQLLTIMKQAQTVQDTLNVQRELSSVRNQIERLQARLENLTGDAAMSTIQLSMSTKESDLPIIDSSQRSIWEEIKLSFKEALTLYRELFIAGLRLVILILPAAIAALVVWMLFKAFKKK
ncbi:MAG TPA: DUF4349 domain-containing protein [Vitreimonas sp.]|nr:DUF4349 domain-containing protein [Vitreimonas sp.]